MIVLENGARIHFEWINPDQSKPVIVFLHEGLGSIEQWKGYPRELCNRTGLPGFVYDRQGHGKSDALSEKREETYLEKYALDELPQVIQAQLDGRDLILYGHSDGGTISLIYASRFPDEIKSIITEAAHIYVEQVTWEGITPVADEFKTQGRFYQALKKYHGEKVEDSFYAWADTWKLKNENHWDVSHYLADVSAPLVAIQGKQDQYATDQHLYDICKGVSGESRAILLDDCKHSPNLEQREEVLKLTSDFILSIA